MVRVLHILGSLDRGGIETWLLHVVRHMDRTQFQMDFVVHTTNAGAYDEEVRALGSRVFPCEHPRRPPQYARNFRSILRDHGPYDIVHSHVHHFSGYTLRLASQEGVPVRMAHSHNDTSPMQAKAGLLRRVYHARMNRWIDCNATVGLAASRKAAASLFGPDWETDRRWRVLFYGIDLAPFQQVPDTTAMRAALNIPPDAFVVGHVGRFDYQKNHPFVVDVFAELARREPKAVLLLVGDGGLRPTIEESIAREGLTDRVILTGVRDDIPQLMMGAMDVFLLPSWFEGLPMVLVESQAAGLPSVISDAITEEATLVEPLMRRLSLTQPPSTWAAEILAVRNAMPDVLPDQARSIVEQSPLNIHESIRLLQGVYHKNGVHVDAQ